AAGFAQTASKPVVVVAWQDNVASAFRARGLPVYADEIQAMDALSALLRLRRLRERGRMASPPASQGIVAADPAPDA
ncbi:CoA-binding protein, partial [Paraburkholderia sp. SIMBA_009]